MDLKIAYPLPKNYPITFDFGESPDWYVAQFGYPHNGLDFGCPIGTPVLATDDGTVIFTDDVPDSGGTGVQIQHSWGSSLYWHLSEISVKSGDQVKKGDVIGKSGNTGYSTGPHLHFGIKITELPCEAMRNWCDPKPYMEEAGEIESEPESKDTVYTVVEGDTLWDISEKFYGVGYQWRTIFDANQEKIEDPNVIYPGQELIIP